MPEKLPNNKHDSISNSTLENEGENSNIKRELPDRRHDLTEAEYKEIMSFIDKISLKYEQKIFLKLRWLKVVLHLERESEKNRFRHFLSSILVLIASAIVTALTGANLAVVTSSCFAGKECYFRLVIFILSLLVTITVGVKNLYKFEEVYWKKRNYAEKLKREGFQFLQLIGDDYSEFRDKAEYEKAYPKFAKNVETLIKEVNEGYTNLFGGAYEDKTVPKPPESPER